MSTESGTIYAWQQVASGLAAVWPTENIREALFDAMERKEVYGTTGSRMTVRFFGGWEFTDQDLRSRQPAFTGYEKGVPMGGDLRTKPGTASAPTLTVYALRDPIGANCLSVRNCSTGRGANFHAGAGLHVADLVHTIGFTKPRPFSRDKI